VFAVDGVVVDYSSQGGLVMMDRAFYRRAWKDFMLTTLHVQLAPGAVAHDVRRAILESFPVDARPTVWLRAQHRAKVAETLDGFFALSRLLVLVALAVGVLGVVNTLQASVLDRWREMAVLRAVGATRNQLSTMVVVESVVLSLCGLLLGTAAGLVAARTMVATLVAAETGWHLPFVTPWSTLLLTATWCVAASVLAAWPAARRASGMNIVQGLEPQG
jgi:putative ABC transport system permease protein